MKIPVSNQIIQDVHAIVNNTIPNFTLSAKEMPSKHFGVKRKQEIPVKLRQNVPVFPPLSTHTRFDFGQTRVTERQKTLSNPESDLLSGNESKERVTMSNSNNNQINVPQAREAMDRFKMQAAQDEDVSFTY